MAEQNARRASEEEYPESEQRTQKKSGKSARKKKNSFGPGPVAIFILVCLILGVMGYRTYFMKQREAAIQEEIAELRLESEEETERAKEIETLATEYQSDEYKERIARSKLGLAKDSEIIFKESEE